MTDEATGPTGPIDETKHSTSLRSRDGGSVTLTRGSPLNALTIFRGGITLTAWLSDDDLRALLVSRDQCCAHCAHARTGSLGATRCYLTARRAGGHLYAPTIPNPKEYVCGKFKPLIRPAARQVAA